MSRRSLVCALGPCLLAGAVLAGEFNEKTVGASLAWEPSKCQKPPRPFFRVTDVDSYNAAVEAYNNHLLRVREYRDCINDEAQRDAETAANAIARGLDEANARIREELDAARAELESAKRALQ